MHLSNTTTALLGILIGYFIFANGLGDFLKDTARTNKVKAFAIALKLVSSWVTSLLATATLIRPDQPPTTVLFAACIGGPILLGMGTSVIRRKLDSPK
jgi:hypothetical protein